MYRAAGALGLSTAGVGRMLITAGSVTFNGTHVSPVTGSSNAIDLGSATQNWRSVYIGTSILLGTGTIAANTSISGGGTIALGGFTLTVPATGIAALLGTANVFTADQNVTISQNGDTKINATNTNGGASARAYMSVNSSGGGVFMTQFGGSYTTSGLYSANLGSIIYSGTNGMLYANGNASTSTYHRWSIGGVAAGNQVMDLTTTGLGVGTTASAKIHALSTTEQLRLGFDGSNFVSFTVSSNGTLTITPGTSPVIFGASGLRLAGPLTFNATAENSNLYVAQTTTTINTSGSGYIYGAASSVNMRVGIRGGTSSVATASNNYGSFIVGANPITIGTSGTHDIFANQVIKALVITSGAAALTNSASLYIEGAATGATNNYTIWSDAGTNRFDGITGIGGVVTPTALLHLAAGTASASTAPLKFTSGTNLTTAEAGAMEYNGTNLFFTRSGTTRESIICANAVNSVSPTAPNRTITVVIDGTTYYLAAKTTND
jgi:hypothetical protein